MFQSEMIMDENQKMNTFESFANTMVLTIIYQLQEHLRKMILQMEKTILYKKRLE